MADTAGFHGCARRAVVERAGVGYCTQHDPDPPSKGELWAVIGVDRPKIVRAVIKAHGAKEIHLTSNATYVSRVGVSVVGTGRAVGLAEARFAETREEALTLYAAAAEGKANRLQHQVDALRRAGEQARQLRDEPREGCTSSEE